MKLVKNITRAFTETWLGFGLFFGFFFILVLYLTASAPNVSTGTFAPTGSMVEVNTDQSTDQGSGFMDDSVTDVKLTPPSNNEENNKTDLTLGENETENSEEIIPMKPICDFSDWRYDGCEMYGDARAMGHENHSIVFFTPPPSQIRTVEAQEWMVRSQSRKIVEVREVIVKSLKSSSPPAPECTVNKSVPALVFATGGLSFNVWHSFSDILIPLFTTSRAFAGEIQFLITDYEYWFVVAKFGTFIKALTNYEIIDFDTDREVRCFPHIIVGLRGHKDLGIDPSRAPRNNDMFQFRMFLREAYSLPLWLDIPYKANTNPNKKPRMLIILRGSTRKFENAPDIVHAAEHVGFEVLTAEPQFLENMEEFSKKVDSCDVLFGAHGAGLTNMLFLRTNAILFQVVTWGNMKWACDAFYNDPARELKLRVAEYNITAEETTLCEKYGKDSVVITDPGQVYKEGNGSRIYWLEQNLRLNITRFTPVLERVYELVKE
ncbi:hypothetical protein LUZ60_012744 [Juncus effusus]|nr:hypothetical protein LUZ60_012744 [Juncus effusus]